MTQDSGSKAHAVTTGAGLMPEKVGGKTPQEWCLEALWPGNHRDGASMCHSFREVRRMSKIDESKTPLKPFCFLESLQSLVTEPGSANKLSRVFKEAVDTSSRPEYFCRTVKGVRERVCEGMTVAVVGAGPVGLRFAVEMAFLGAKVLVLEKRLDFSRDNVLHLWRWVAFNLRSSMLAHPFGVAAALSGNSTHLSTSRLQSQLLRLCLLLGVDVRLGTKFRGVERATLSSTDNGSSPPPRWAVTYTQDEEDDCIRSYPVHTIVGADGTCSRVADYFGFERVEGHCSRESIGVVANFHNAGRKEDKQSPEVLGLGGIKSADFITRLRTVDKIGLQNVVYFREVGPPGLHYLVFSTNRETLDRHSIVYNKHARRTSIGSPGEMNKSSPGSRRYSTATEMPSCRTADPGCLLSTENIDKGALERMVRTVATAAGIPTSAPYKLRKNGATDVSIFDFSTASQAVDPVKVIPWSESGASDGSHSCQDDLQVYLIGDALHAPFWPEGIGINRGFIFALDVAFTLSRQAIAHKSGVPREQWFLPTLEAHKDLVRLAHTIKSPADVTDEPAVALYPLHRYGKNNIVAQKALAPLKQLGIPEMIS